jgi:hypothetical protein
MSRMGPRQVLHIGAALLLGVAELLALRRARRRDRRQAKHGH